MSSRQRFPRPIVKRRARRSLRPVVESLELRLVLSSSAAVPGVVPLEVMGPKGGWVPSRRRGRRATRRNSFRPPTGSIGQLRGHQGGWGGPDHRVGRCLRQPQLRELDRSQLQYQRPAYLRSSVRSARSAELHQGQSELARPRPLATAPLGSVRRLGRRNALDIEWAHAMAPAANIILVRSEWRRYRRPFSGRRHGRHAGLGGLHELGRLEYPGRGEPRLDLPGTGSDLPGLHGRPWGSRRLSRFLAPRRGGRRHQPVQPRLQWGLSRHGNQWRSRLERRKRFLQPQHASGGGISQFEPEPSYQTSVQSTGFRTIPDISADADPNTGVPIYDPYDFGTGHPGYRSAAPAFPRR